MNENSRSRKRRKSETTTEVIKPKEMSTEAKEVYQIPKLFWEILEIDEKLSGRGQRSKTKTPELTLSLTLNDFND